jgi:hypothetical protein
VGSRVGTEFGKYNITRLLGTGGMGEVYEAYDTAKGRTVALKILPDELSNDVGFRTRFQRESQAAAILQEPHVIPIHDWGEIDGNLYIDMRLVQGQTLFDLIADGPLAPSRAVAIISQVGAALDAAHAEGLIHRDIKPQNVIVTPADFAYLVDFGIAESKGDTRLTVAGTHIGTLTYMAPERFSGKVATPAVDVYSLACVLYESLTGDAPFAGDTIENLLAAHLTSTPPRPSVANPRVPAALDDVTARGMAKDPDDRYGTAGGLGRAAQRALQTGETNRATAMTVVPRGDPAPAGDGTAPQGADGVGSPHARTIVGPPSGVAATDPTAAQGAPGAGSGGRGWVLPTVIAVAAALILSGIGVAIALLAKQGGGSQTLPSQVTGPEQTGQGQPATDGDAPFRGFVLQQPSVEVRAEPRLSAPVIGYLPYESEVFIVCTTIADAVEGPGAGGGPSIATPVWDKVRTALDGADLGFVPDAWVKTGTAQPRARIC